MRYVGDLLVTDNPRPLDPDCLGKARPVQIATKPAATKKMANFDSPVPFVDFANLIKLLAAQAFAVGGKGRG